MTSFTRNNIIIKFFTRFILVIILLNLIFLLKTDAEDKNNQVTLFINEFMDSNGDTILGKDGDSSDWIEIYNPTDKPKYILQPTPAAPNNTRGFFSLKTAGFYSFYLNNKLLIHLIIILLLILVFLSIIFFRATVKLKQSKSQLKKINEEQALLLNNIQTQIWYLKDVDRYGRANKAHLDFFDINIEGLENRSLFEIRGEKEAAVCIKGNIEVFKKKKQIKTEEWVKNGKGEKRLLSIIKTPKLDDNGQVEFVICSAEDITEKKRIEDQIRNLAQEYETIINYTQDAIFLVNVENQEFKYHRLNSIHEKLTGFTTEKIKGKSPIEIVGKKLGKIIEANYRRCLEEKKTISYEEELELPAGKRVWHTNLSPVIVNGEVVQLVGVSRDITERKQMEKKLKQNENEYRNLFEESPIGLVKVDNKGNIIDINKEMLNLLGSPGKEETLQFNLLKMSNLQIAGLSQQLELVIKKGRPISGEKFYTSYWGKKLWLNYSIKPILDEKGEVTEVIIVCQDTTEKRKAEERIKYLTFHDSLTGLYNRAYFNEEMKRYNTERQLPLSIIIGDVNGLKLTNDVFGHQEGDNLLIKVARIIKSSCRQEDLVARWGGDEFVILLPQTDEKVAREICLRIKESCRKSRAEPIKPSIALGYATQKEPGEDIRDIFKKAEDCMYKNKLNESKNTHNAIISSLKKALSETAYISSERSQQVKKLALELGRALKLTDYELTHLDLLAELYDLGKVVICPNIIQKQGSLTPEEWKEIKRHPEIGYQIANSSPELSNIAEGILSHHEWWDGSGYPRGLKGEKIPLISRIIAIVDAYDVMTNGGPYKEAISKEEAIKELEKGAGSQFDPEIVDIFINQVLAE
ncbi:MAG: hypothetical protein PWR10_1079 [Halanaerobiales bacterium]|nr:hypothetical protein [Halanaerobiales bacterium]